MTVADLPYHYFVSYAHGRGFGALEVRTSSPLTSYEQVSRLRTTIAEAPTISPTPSGLRADEIAVLNFILLSGPEAQR
jgi:hypothetical protein